MLINVSCPACIAATLLLAAVGVADYTLHAAERNVADATLHSSQLPFTAATESWTLRDPSGQQRSGKSSFYANRFTGRIMADGTSMDPQGDIAASNLLRSGTAVAASSIEVPLSDGGV